MLAMFSTALRVFLLLTTLTGIAYPAVATLIGNVGFPRQSAGSLLERDGKVVGSELIAQKFSSAKYYHPRPSAGDFATVASAASNLAPTSETLKVTVDSRIQELGPGTPPELVLASASGLDPHVSPAGARHQIDRIMAARGLPHEERPEIEAMLTARTEGPTFGVFGMPRLNVLALNLDLDRRYP